MRTKKTIVSALALGLGLTAGIAQAQTEAGKLLVSGRINYSHSKGEGTTTDPIAPNSTLYQESQQSNFNFTPQLGFFVADNLALGLGVSVGANKFTEDRRNESINSSYNYSSTNKEKVLSVGPFVRYYKMIGEKTGFYGQLSGGYQRQTRNSSSSYRGANVPENYTSETKITGGYGSLTPGFVFFPTKKLGLELTMGGLAYSNLKSKLQNAQPFQGDSDSSSSYFGADFGLQNLAIGASFQLGN